MIEAAGPLTAPSIADDIGTLRAAWPSVRALAADALAAGDAGTVHRLIRAVTSYAEQTFAFEVIDWADAAIALDEQQGVVTPSDTHLAAGLLRTHRSDFDGAAEHLVLAEDADAANLALARLWWHYFTGDLAAADDAADRIRQLTLGSGSYTEVVGAIASQFLDKGAQRPFDPDVVARLDEWAVAGDPVVAAGAELCAALRLDWLAEAESAVERLTAIVDRARLQGLAFLASGASTARSIVLAIAPDAGTSARVLRATLRSYADTGSWQFALADFAAVALALVRHDRAREAAELLGARRASGYVGDASADVEQQAVAAALDRLGRRAFDEALRQGTSRDAATATRLALAALDDVLERGRGVPGRQ